MDKLVKRRSEIERMVKAGEATVEPPRQPIRHNKSGQILSNERLPEATLPAFLIERITTFISYNDIDVETFNREVQQQATRILTAMKDERFDNAGLAYQQFIDQYDACIEAPTVDSLQEVKRGGIDLYAILENQGSHLGEELSTTTRIRATRPA